MGIMPVCFWSVLLSLSTLTFGAANSSDPCLPPWPETWDGWPILPEIYISSQSDVELLADCVLINASVIITQNFTGTLSLPKLVSVAAVSTEPHSSIAVLSLPQLSEVFEDGFVISADNMTTLDLPVLNQSDIVQVYAPTLTNWTGTNMLQNVWVIQIDAHNLTSLEFQNLSSLLQIRVNFTSAEAVRLIINGSNPFPPDVWIFGNDKTQLEVWFKKLRSLVARNCFQISVEAQTVGYMEISENPQLNLLQVPEVYSLGPPVSAYQEDGGATWPPPLAGQTARYMDSLYLDSLLIVNNQLSESIYFPSLTTIQGNLQVVYAGVGLPEGGIVGENELQFPVLSNVTDSILIEGYVSGLEVPSLLNVGGVVNVSTNSNLNCSQLQTLFNQSIVHGGQLICETAAGNYSLPTGVPPAAAHKGFSKKTLAGIAVGVVIAAILISSSLAWCVIKASHHRRSVL